LDMSAKAGKCLPAQCSKDDNLQLAYTEEYNRIRPLEKTTAVRWSIIRQTNNWFIPASQLYYRLLIDSIWLLATRDPWLFRAPIWCEHYVNIRDDDSYLQLTFLFLQGLFISVLKVVTDS
jgi:hypothetical protein